MSRNNKLLFEKIQNEPYLCIFFLSLQPTLKCDNSIKSANEV